MGARKRLRAEKLKEARKQEAFAKYNNCPCSPRKMRMVADLVRGEEVFKAMSILQYSSRDAAQKLEKVLRSAIANWEQKNEGADPTDSGLYVKEVKVDKARTLKRLRPRAQGRAFRIEKHSNHTTLVLGTKQEQEQEA
jgi:large subunit ribosomal protein L22